MGTFGWGELLVILIIVIVIFGTSRISSIGSALGGSIRDFKKAVRDDSQPAGDRQPHVNEIEAESSEKKA